MPGFNERAFTLLLPLLLFLISTPAFCSILDSGNISRGNEEYHKGNYDEALKHYLKEDRPSDIHKWHFNLGNAFLRKGETENALREYTKAAESPDHRLKAYAHYNSGNAYFAGKELEKAKNSYIEALKLHHGDRDLSYNLQRALELLQEQQKEQEQQEQNQDNQEQQEKDQEQNQQQQKQNQEQNQQQQNQEQQKQDQEKQENDSDKDEKSVPEQLKEQFLENLMNKEKEINRKISDTMAGEGYYNDKDW